MRIYHVPIANAGLAAALTLKRSGRCEVVVLEAGSRSGGRAYTQKISPELALELGSTWFHGLGSQEEPHPVFRHAVEQGLIGEKPTGDFDCLQAVSKLIHCF
jgi:phytoene dehydrogenase-like protein